MPGEALLQTRGLTKRFGGLVALEGIGVEVHEGRVTSLIGPNGAGKTTFFNCICGIVPISSGEVLFRGEPIGGLAPYRIAARGIGRTFQGIRLFLEMTVLENVMVGAHLRGRTTPLSALFARDAMQKEERELQERAEAILDFVGLAARRDQLARQLPYGDQRRLEIARALASEPALLLLDEPAAGMNPREASDLGRLIFAIRDRGITLLLIEHNMRLVMEISERIYVLDHGVKIAEGTPEEIRKDMAVIEAYLGKGA